MQANMDRNNKPESSQQTTEELLSNITSFGQKSKSNNSSHTALLANIFGNQTTTATVTSMNGGNLTPSSMAQTINAANLNNVLTGNSLSASAIRDAAAETKASEWTDEKVKTMLNLRIAYKDKFDSRAFKKNKLWDEIASQVNGQFPGTKLTGSMCNDKFRYLKHRYLLSEQYRRVYGTTDGGLKQADRHSPSAGGQDENSIRAPHFIYGNEFNHLFGTDLDTLLIEKTNSRPFIETTNNALVNGGHGHQVLPVANKEDKKTACLAKAAISTLQSFGQKMKNGNGVGNGKRSMNASFDMPSMVDANGLDLLTQSGVQDLLGLGNKRKHDILSESDLKRIKMENERPSNSTTPNENIVLNPNTSVFSQLQLLANNQPNSTSSPMPPSSSSNDNLLSSLLKLQNLKSTDSVEDVLKNIAEGSGHQSPNNQVNINQFGNFQTNKLMNRFNQINGNQNHENSQNTNHINGYSNGHQSQSHTGNIINVNGSLNGNHNGFNSSNDNLANNTQDQLNQALIEAATHSLQKNSDSEQNKVILTMNNDNVVKLTNSDLIRLNNEINNQQTPIRTSRNEGVQKSLDQKTIENFLKQQEINNPETSQNSQNEVRNLLNTSNTSSSNNNQETPNVVSQNLLYSALSRIATSLENQERQNVRTQDRLVTCLEAMTQAIGELKQDIKSLRESKCGCGGKQEVKQEIVDENMAVISGVVDEKVESEEMDDEDVEELLKRKNLMESDEDLPVIDEN